jgi:restriction endonuclease S subunit
MSKFEEVEIGEIFDAANGHPKYIKDYMDAHPGDYPVYSASLTKAFGYVDSYDYDGHYLTWVMNGYGGRIQEVRGKFSANRDRGVFLPKKGVETPDLTYLRFAMEPQLNAAAVGRRVDGKLNEYTKIYPEDAKAVALRVPVDAQGRFDYVEMQRIGVKIRAVEAAQKEVLLALAPLLRAEFPPEVDGPTEIVSLGNEDLFALSIGKRVVKSEFHDTGVPAYSANARQPFGHIEKSNLNDFSKPSLLWGIDGNFDWNIINSGVEFATTDHCGRLQIGNGNIDPHYVFQFLRATRGRYGFDRVYRASLTNVKHNVTVTIPIDPDSGEYSLDRQYEIALVLASREQARTATVNALSEVLKARISIEAF